MDGARIYAESAIREKNQALNYLRLSNRIDAVAQRVNTAVKMNTLTKTMGGVVRGMDVALQNMNVEQISQIMDKFEKQFEDLDVSSKVMESSMSSSTSVNIPVGQVDDLMKQMAEEHGLEFQSQMDQLKAGTNPMTVKAPPVKEAAAKNTVALVASGSTARHPAPAATVSAPPAPDVSVSSGASAEDEERALEERLKRLQGL